MDDAQKLIDVAVAIKAKALTPEQQELRRWTDKRNARIQEMTSKSGKMVFGAGKLLQGGQ